jgi:hypothetical protein
MGRFARQPETSFERRSIHWRLERRGGHYVFCSTLHATRDEVIRMYGPESAEFIGPNQREGEVTVESDLSPPPNPGMPSVVFNSSDSSRATGAKLVLSHYPLPTEDFATLAARWRTSPTTDPAVRRLFWTDAGRAICASCRKVREASGFLCHPSGPDFSEVWVSLCNRCERKFIRPAKRAKLLKRLSLIIRGALRRN